MKKLFGFIKTICWIVIIPTGLLSLIYEYIIWDKSVLSDFSKSFFDATFVVGFIAILVLLITIIIDKIIFKIKWRNILKNK